MKAMFIQYPTCSTCRNAKKFLLAHDVSFQDRHIVEDTPSFEELKQWTQQFEIDPKKLFNTSGKVYKELKLKDQMAILNTDEMLHLLARNGMLIKRPLLILEDTMLVGFKADAYEYALSK